MEDVCTQVQTDAFILPKSEFRELLDIQMTESQSKLVFNKCVA